ncbi:MAG: hypothetical protein ACON4M_05725 [Crocinitomicaceae bacterium]
MMKAKTFLGFTLLFLLIGGLLSFISSPSGSSKCSGDNEYASGLGKLGAYKLIKDYRIEMKKGEGSRSYMISLKAGLKYRFLPVNSPDNKKNMIMSIYMSKNKGMMLATSFNPASKKHYPTIDFACRTTGTFYLFFEFEGDEKGCGVGLFSVAN